MQFKTPRIRGEWLSGNLDKNLTDAVTEAYNYAGLLGWEFTLTSIKRTPEEDIAAGGNGNGVHVHWRGVDVRTRDIDPFLITSVDKFTNKRWRYNHKKAHAGDKKVCFSQPHGNGPHLHFQSHPNTRNRIPWDLINSGGEYISGVRIFAFNWAPRHMKVCDALLTWSTIFDQPS